MNWSTVMTVIGWLILASDAVHEIVMLFAPPPLRVTAILNVALIGGVLFFWGLWPAVFVAVLLNFISGLITIPLGILISALLGLKPPEESR